METISSSETSVSIYQTTWCNIPEESHLLDRVVCTKRKMFLTTYACCLLCINYYLRCHGNVVKGLSAFDLHS
jgi:hypothetical protein